MMTFASSLVGIIEVGTNHFITHPRWYVMGERGTLQVDDWNCGGAHRALYESRKRVG